VTLQDAFGKFRTRIGALTSLCVPVQTTVNGVSTTVMNPTKALVCFSVIAKAKHEKVFDKNGFGAGPVSVAQVLDLCLPSTFGS